MEPAPHARPPPLRRSLSPQDRITAHLGAEVVLLVLIQAPVFSLPPPPNGSLTSRTNDKGAAPDARRGPARSSAGGNTVASASRPRRGPSLCPPAALVQLVVLEPQRLQSVDVINIVKPNKGGANRSGNRCSMPGG